MSVRIFSKLCNKCSICSNRDKCNHKRMVACLAIEMPEINMESLIVPNKASYMSKMTKEQRLRNIKLDEQTTVTIDLEEIKRQIKKDFYKSMNCSFMKR